MPEYPPRWVHAGFERRAECHQHIWLHGRSVERGVIFPSRSGRILHWSLPKESAFGPLLVSSVAHQAQSHGKSAVMLLLVAVGWTIDQVQRNGMLTEPLGDRGQVSWRATRSSVSTSRNVWLGRSPMREASLSTARGWYGRNGGRFIVRAAGGQRPGALSKSLTALRLTIQRMTPCGSVMRQSISPCTSKDAVRCAES